MGVVADIVVPGSGTIGGLVDDLRAERNARRNRWQGFLVSFDRRVAEQRPEGQAS